MIKDHDSSAIFEEKEDNRVTYHLDLLDADKYLSQFLNAEDLDLESYQKQYEGSQIQPMVLSIKHETKKGFKIQEGDKRKTKKYSCFQNFQKHLVTTIRSIFDTSKLGRFAETAQCQRKLWKIFLNSNKINKTLVSLIVGDITSESIAKVTEYGFNQILEDYPLKEIKESQQNIRQQVLIQLKEANLDEEIEKRRLKNKRQFVVYFNAFIAELESGDLDKRMSKCTKLLKSQFL